MTDRDYMERAIMLAQKGMGWTAPNPMVGAVIVKDGRIIGEGWHRRCGDLHAERNAIASLTESAEGATIYVTLEPCCHHGRTPPCTDAIIENKIARVVIGSGDPNPKVAGKGAAILKEHGIEVIEGFLADVEAQLEQRNNVMVAVSEGIRDKDGNYISASEAAADGFGHSQLSGTGKVLEQIISDRLKIKARSVEVNILQRCAAHLSSLTDLDESAAQGAKAHALAQEGHSGIMVTIKRISDKPYTIEAGYAKIDKVANQVKSVPDKWISAAGNDVTKEMVEYLSPLIQGEPEVEYKDGLPQYLFRTYYRKA